MKFQENQAIKVLGKGGYSVHGGYHKWSLPVAFEGGWVPGAWTYRAIPTMTLDGHGNGVHVSGWYLTREPIYWWPSGEGVKAYLAEWRAEEEPIVHKDKYAVSMCRLLRPLTPEEIKGCGVYITGDIPSILSGCVRVGGDARVRRIGGTASVVCIDGDADVDLIEGQAKVRTIRGGALVDRIRGDATVSDLSGFSHVKKIEGRCQVDGITGAATVDNIGGHARVDIIDYSVCVREILGHAKIGSINSLQYLRRIGPSVSFYGHRTHKGDLRGLYQLRDREIEQLKRRLDGVGR